MAEFREKKRDASHRLQLGRPRKTFNYSTWKDDQLAKEYSRQLAIRNLADDRATAIAMEMFNRGGG